MIFWALAYGGVALALLLATLATFNRCLGRIDDPRLFDGRTPSSYRMVGSVPPSTSR